MKTLILTDREFEIINNRCNIPTLAFDNAIPKGMTKDDFRIPIKLTYKLEELE